MPSLVGSQPEVPCARCGQRVAGIGWGELCPACRSEIRRRANRISGRSALAATLLAAAYVWWRLPPGPPLGRIYGGIAVLATYIIIRRIVSRVAMDWLSRPEKKE
jgi:hypothetical protein